MIVVTGAAGFIGSCVVAKLNELGQEDLILVDHFDDDQSISTTESQKKLNLEGKQYNSYYDKKEFLHMVVQDNVDAPIDAVIHMGACSSTTLQDAPYFEENNYQYTLSLAQWCLDHNVRFIYASSAATYGDGSNGYKDDDDTTRHCKPLNLYGESKQKFDLWALNNGYLNRMVGLKFFNVFGPNEYHKGEMRSVMAKSCQKVLDEGVMSLFKSLRAEYQDGEQRRDFVYVKDAVDVVLYFWTHPDINGLFNVGTGESRSWNDLARAIFKAADKPTQINYIDMPEGLQERYQYFTEADMSKLRQQGYTQPFMSLESAVKDYSAYLKETRYW